MFCTNSELLYKPDYSRGTVLHGRRYLVILILNNSHGGSLQSRGAMLMPRNKEQYATEPFHHFSNIRWLWWCWDIKM